MWDFAQEEKLAFLNSSLVISTAIEAFPIAVLMHETILCSWEPRDSQPKKKILDRNRTHRLWLFNAARTCTVYAVRFLVMVKTWMGREWNAYFFYSAGCLIS